MKPLTYPMKLALRDIADEKKYLRPLARDWVDTHTLKLNRGTVKALERRGLIDRDLWYVRLTDEGRAVALALYKYKGATDV